MHNIDLFVLYQFSDLYIGSKRPHCCKRQKKQFPFIRFQLIVATRILYYFMAIISKQFYFVFENRMFSATYLIKIMNH